MASSQNIQKKSTVVDMKKRSVKTVIITPCSSHDDPPRRPISSPTDTRGNKKQEITDPNLSGASMTLRVRLHRRNKISILLSLHLLPTLAVLSTDFLFLFLTPFFSHFHQIHTIPTSTTKLPLPLSTNWIQVVSPWRHTRPLFVPCRFSSHPIRPSTPRPLRPAWHQHPHIPVLLKSSESPHLVATQISPKIGCWLSESQVATGRCGR